MTGSPIIDGYTVSFDCIVTDIYGKGAHNVSFAEALASVRRPEKPVFGISSVDMFNFIGWLFEDRYGARLVSLSQRVDLIDNC